MEVLAIAERVQKTIDLGESQFREFKSALEGRPGAKRLRDPKAIAKDITETLVAFANADGGELLVGVEDDGTLTGVSYDSEITASLLNIHKQGVHSDTPLANPIARKITLSDKDILYFAIEKSTRVVHQTSDGRCLQRRDRENLPVSAQHLQFERQEQVSREYDRAFLDGTGAHDLDISLVQQVSDHLRTSWSPEKFLQYLGLGEFGGGIFRLRRAALLLFATDVTHFHPRCQVRILRVRGVQLKSGRDYNVISDEYARGNILQLITSAWEKLRRHLVETKLGPNTLFTESVMYPEDACKEALINAIAHRDYSIEGQGIEILVFDDRMEVHSPGGLLSNIRADELKKLQGIHESRNALTTRVLREIGYMQEMGEGIRRIFLLMRGADLVAPEIQSEPTRFSMTLRHKSVFSDEDQRWLDAFRPLNLTREEMLIALLGKDGARLSPQQIYDGLNLVDWDVYRQIIDQIQTKGILFNVSKTKQGKRSRPRLVVRQPLECERGISELLGILRQMKPVEVLDRGFLKELFDTLPVTSPYRNDTLHLGRLLQLLGLSDQSRRPTSLMLGLWREGRSGTPWSFEIPVSSPTTNAPAKIAEVTGQAAKPQDTIANSELRTVYVGNLDYDTTPDELCELFRRFGDVSLVRLPTDQFTGRARGFAFVRMASASESGRAMAELHGVMFRKRRLVVRPAHPRFGK